MPRGSKSDKAQKGIIRLFFTVCFAAKLRLCVKRLRKRKQIIKEWIDLENANLKCIELINAKATVFKLTSSQLSTILHGLQIIAKQSHYLVIQLGTILASKGSLFGKIIVQICSSFEVYTSYLKTYVERLTIIKELSDRQFQSSLENQELASSRIILEENAQKIVFRTYQISMLITKYIKCLTNTNKDENWFKKGLEILTNLNKKYDLLIREEQKEKEMRRLEKLIGEKVNVILIYSEKGFWHLGEVRLHIFQNMVVVEESNRAVSLMLDKYCSIFVKYFECGKLACLVTKVSTVHFNFAFSKQLSKFVRVVQSVIRAEACMQNLAISQVPSLFNPFLAAQVVDYREVKSLREGRKQEFTIIFTSIYDGEQVAASESDRFLIHSSMRESGLNWEDSDGLNQMELNETVALSMADLLKIKKLCETEYNVQKQLPKLQNFSGEVGWGYLLILQWECYLNSVLRSKTIINNPILILKQLQVTDVFLETSLSKSTLSLEDNKRYHCRLCSRVVITNMKRYFSLRLHFITDKYNSECKECCYYIFQKIREEVCRISIHELANCKELIAWRQFRKGTIDYCFRKLVGSDRQYFVEVGVLSIEEISFEVEINQYTLVSEVIDQICLLLQVPTLSGYRLFIIFEDEEIMLRTNELIFSAVTAYNVRHQNSNSSSFFSKIRSLGKFIQMAERGILILKQVLYYPLSEGEHLQREWELKFLAYQFKEEKLTGLAKDLRFELIVLFTIKHLVQKGKALPNAISSKHYERFVPNSLEEEAEESREHIQKLYLTHKGRSPSEIDQLIEARLSVSHMFRKYTVEMRVVEMSEGLTSSKKRLKSVVVGMGWKGLVILSFNEKIIMKGSWDDLKFCLGSLGLKIFSDSQEIILKCAQLYEIYQICLEYKGLNEQLSLISSK